MTWDLNEEWVKRARDRGAPAHRDCAVRGWEVGASFLLVTCGCGPRLPIRRLPIRYDVVAATRWHDEDEERDAKRENPRCEHGLLKDGGCLDCEVPAPVTCTRGESSDRALQRISSELGRVRTENAALSGAMDGMADRNAELEDEVATLRARVVELEGQLDHHHHKAQLLAMRGVQPERPHVSAVATAPPFKFHRGPVIRCDGGE